MTTDRLGAVCVAPRTQLQNIAAYSKHATAEKYLINPNEVG
ncbi:MAG: hypothetical protein ACLPTZ_26950 [Beijerinckiaceae bacterium]